MKKIFHMRSRSRLKSSGTEAHIYGDSTQWGASELTTRLLASRLPTRILDIIFIYVCPHVRDASYATLEESMTENACMLCDMRDLAHCARVNRAWAQVAQKLLYHSVRFDPVHYCEREIMLATNRKRGSFFDRNGDPKDPAEERLKQFSASVRSNGYLADLVLLLKMPYMIRESCKADVARTISVLPNLRYVDLPEGLFSDESPSIMLKQELEHRCPEIRKMKYSPGSEGSFARLAQSRIWQNLEIVELEGLAVEPDTLLYVLASFHALQKAKLGDMSSLDDTIFIPNNLLPPFPPLTSLSLRNTPSISTSGLVAYLSRPDAREVLTHLTLSETGIYPQNLHEFLLSAPHLSHLSIKETVSRSFPLKPVPPLASRSLYTLHYEIQSSSPSPHPPSESYYTYLASSLLSSSLPSLHNLYTLCPSLPDLLLFPPSAPFTNDNPSSRFSTASSLYSTPSPTGWANLPGPHVSGIISPLSLYSKPPEYPEQEWCVTAIEPASERNGRRSSVSATRPISLVASERSASPNSGSGRSNGSTYVGNGFGGFLAVPSEDAVGRGRSGVVHGRRASQSGEWMG
ncbi:hypothetical protein MMC13_002222 [Lambiella insularis]|nr:hypothetical protein [Lambiella insularis]